MTRVEADTLRIEMGEYAGWLQDKYTMSYADTQALNDLAYKIVIAMEHSDIQPYTNISTPVSPAAKAANKNAGGKN